MKNVTKGEENSSPAISSSYQKTKIHERSKTCSSVCTALITFHASPVLENANVRNKVSKVFVVVDLTPIQKLDLRTGKNFERISGNFDSSFGT